MRKFLFFLIVLFLLSSFAYAQPATCSNGVKDENEDGIDCGLAVCGVPCLKYVGEELPSFDGSKTQNNNMQPPPPSSGSQSNAQTNQQQQVSQQEQQISQQQTQQQGEELPSSPGGQQLIEIPQTQETGTPSVGKAGDYLSGATKNIFIYALYFIAILGIVGAAYYTYSVMGKGIPQVQINSELLNYIRKCQYMSIPKEKIIEKLLQVGYSMEEITSHFKELEKE